MANAIASPAKVYYRTNDGDVWKLLYGDVTIPAPSGVIETAEAKRRRLELSAVEAFQLEAFARMRRAWLQRGRR